MNAFVLFYVNGTKARLVILPYLSLIDKSLEVLVLHQKILLN